MLELTHFGVELVEDQRRILFGKLNVLHGHELARGFAPPVNPARGAYLKTKSNTVVSHHHKTSEHVEHTMDGHVVSCWSTGCLCDLSPRYNPYAGSNHGYALIEFDGEQFTVRNRKVIDGRPY